MIADVAYVSLPVGALLTLVWKMNNSRIKRIESDVKEIDVKVDKLQAGINNIKVTLAGMNGNKP